MYHVVFNQVDSRVPKTTLKYHKDNLNMRIHYTISLPSSDFIDVMWIAFENPLEGEKAE